MPRVLNFVGSKSCAVNSSVRAQKQKKRGGEGLIFASIAKTSTIHINIDLSFMLLKVTINEEPRQNCCSQILGFKFAKPSGNLQYFAQQLG